MRDIPAKRIQELVEVCGRLRDSHAGLAMTLKINIATDRDRDIDAGLGAAAPSVGAISARGDAAFSAERDRSTIVEFEARFDARPWLDK